MTNYAQSRLIYKIKKFMKEDLTGQLVRAPMKTGMRNPDMWPTVLDRPKMVPELFGAILRR